MFSHFNLSFDTKWFNIFDKENFKIKKGDGADINGSDASEHTKIFGELDDFFTKALMEAGKDFKDIINLKKHFVNKSIYGTLSSYFRYFIPHDKYNYIGLSIVMERSFISIEAGFQIKGIPQDYIQTLNSWIINSIKEECSLHMEKYGFDVLLTCLKGKNEVISLSELISNDFWEDIDDGLIQLRWTAPREDIERDPVFFIGELLKIMPSMCKFIDNNTYDLPSLSYNCASAHEFRIKTINIQQELNDILLYIVKENNREDSDRCYDDLDQKVRYTMFINLIRKSILDLIERSDEISCPAFDEDEYLESIEAFSFKKLPINNNDSIHLLNDRMSTDITLVAYRDWEQSTFTYSLYSFTTPITPNIRLLDEYDIIESMTQNGKTLELLDSESEAGDENSLMIFMGDRLVTRLDFSSFNFIESVYDEWDDELKSDFESFLENVIDALFEEYHSMVIES